MTELEATQHALTAIGTQATVPEIIGYAKDHLGVRLEQRFVPVYLATLRGQHQRQQMRATAAEVVRTEVAKSPRR
jgi:hypothetical protein